MSAWTRDELESIAAADELEVTALRRDGTPRAPVTIWVVRVGEGLYVRSWRGANGSWFRAAQARPEGRISAAGVDKDVAFVDADAASKTRSTMPTEPSTAATRATSSRW